MDKKVKRGVAIYSYSGEYGRTMNLEDCFKDMQDMGATGIEILANSHIDSYPELSEEYVAKWEYLCGKYGIEPVEYGHWIDTRLYKNRDMSMEEAKEKLINDFKIAHRLGFKILRTKMGVINGELAPVENWREIIKSVLPEAEKYDVIMCPEIHLTTVLARCTRRRGIQPRLQALRAGGDHSSSSLRQVHPRQIQQDGRQLQRADDPLSGDPEDSR